MKREIPQRILNTECEAIVELLTIRQHVRPHALLGEVVCVLTDELGCCPNALKSAIEWLRLDPHQPIGRLRRTELIQLSKAVQRHWRRGVAAETSGSIPS